MKNVSVEDQKGLRADLARLRLGFVICVVFRVCCVSATVDTGCGPVAVIELLRHASEDGERAERMPTQPCDAEGEPLPGTELKEVWRVADAPPNDKFQYTYFAHKINSFDTAPRKLLASDSRLRPDRYALEKGDMSKAGAEKSSLEEKQRAEKRTREAKGDNFSPRWFDMTEEVATTPWGELEIYRFNGKYLHHRTDTDSSDNIELEDVQTKEFNPWQYGDLSGV